MDGVLHCEYNPINGSDKIFDVLKNIGINSTIVTNECRFTINELRNKLV